MVNVWTASLEHPWLSVSSGSCLLLWVGGRGTELDLCSSEIMTALLMQQFLGTFAQQQKASIPFIVSVCRTVCLQASARFPPDGSTWNFGGFSLKSVKKIQNWLKWDIKGPFTRRSNYVSLYLATLVSHKCVINEWNFIKFLWWPRWHKHYADSSHFYIIRTLCVCLYLKETEIFICTYWCSQNELQYTAAFISKDNC